MCGGGGGGGGQGVLTQVAIYFLRNTGTDPTSRGRSIQPSVKYVDN